MLPVERLFQCELALVHIACDHGPGAVAVDGAADAVRQLGVPLEQQCCPLGRTRELGVPQTVKVLRVDLGGQRAGAWGWCFYIILASGPRG